MTGRRENNMGNEKIFIPEDFGAKGDGNNDDGIAIDKAINAAIQNGGKVLLKKGAVYYMKEVGNAEKIAINLNNAQNVTIEGDDTTVVLGKNTLYFSFMYCENITLKGINFEYATHTAMRGRFVSVSPEKCEIVIKTDYPVPLNGEESFCYCDFKNHISPYAFAMPDDNFRNHIYLREIKKIGENTYSVWCENDRQTRDAIRIVANKKCDLILPTPGMSHSGEAFRIMGCKNITVEQCDIRESVQFVGNIRGNSGEIFFKNVKICSEDRGAQPMVGWRDGYHCKDNSAPIHWENCYIGRIYDDAFNISATYFTVEDIIDKHTVAIKCTEYGGAYYTLYNGGTVSIYDTVNGKIISEENPICEIIKQYGADIVIRLKEELCDFDLKNAKLIFENYAAPGSTVDNCIIKGTVRFRGPLTVRDSYFDLLLMWIENECDIEGPVPKNMKYINCDFKSVYPVCERYMENYISLATTQIYPGYPEYKLKNILFEDCRLDSQYLYVEPGNDVKFVNCKENDKES